MYPQNDVKGYLAGLVSTSSPPAAVSFLDQDYCYKTVATQITDEAVLALIP